MEKVYNKNELYFYLVNQDVSKAIDYLMKFPDQIKLLKKYQKVFNRRVIRPKKINPTIDNTILIYNNYYIDILYLKKDPKIAINSLIDNLNKLYDINYSSFNSSLTLQEIEKFIEKRMQEFGYYFLGGEISGLYGPYIWKETKHKWFKVELPFDSINVKVTFCDKFISKSWLDFISFSKISIDNWYSSNNGLFCNLKRYKNSLNKPKFLISFLKHEAMHILDYHVFGKMKTKDLEYRAILVELIYYPNISKLKSVLNLANLKNQDSYLEYASCIIIRNLSRLIFGEEYINDIDIWKGKNKKVQEYSLFLLNEHNQKIKESFCDEIDII